MFELKHSNKNGSFSVMLCRQVSLDDMQQLVLLANNLLTDEAAAKETDPAELSPAHQADLLSHLRNSSSTNQTRLGEKPVQSIMTGTYREPLTGVRIRMLSFPGDAKMRAVRMFSDATGISTLGSKEVMFGNYPCPLLTQETAEKIMIGLAGLGVHAKIVNADEATGPIANAGF